MAGLALLCGWVSLPKCISYVKDRLHLKCIAKVQHFHCGLRIPTEENFFLGARSFGHLVICQNRKQTMSKPPLYINILIFIYSEQWPRFRNRFWPFWPWPNDHTTAAKKSHFIDNFLFLTGLFSTAHTRYAWEIYKNKCMHLYLYWFRKAPVFTANSAAKRPE